LHSLQDQGRICKARCSERKGRLLPCCCLAEDKAVDLIGHLAAGNRGRATAWRVGVAPSAVVRYFRLVGPHARQFHLGARTAEQAEALVADVYQRMEGRPLRLIICGNYSAYKDAILCVHCSEVTTTPTGRDSKRMEPEKAAPRS
jgi:hypothetical protein